MTEDLDVDELREMLDRDPTECWPIEDIHPLVNRIERAEGARTAARRSNKLLAQKLSESGARAEVAEAKVARVEEVADMIISEYGDRVYGGNGYAEGITRTARHILTALEATK